MVQQAAGTRRWSKEVCNYLRGFLLHEGITPRKIFEPAPRVGCAESWVVTSNANSRMRMQSQGIFRSTPQV